MGLWGKDQSRAISQVFGAGPVSRERVCGVDLGILQQTAHLSRTGHSECASRTERKLKPSVRVKRSPGEEMYQQGSVTGLQGAAGRISRCLYREPEWCQCHKDPVVILQISQVFRISLRCHQRARTCSHQCPDSRVTLGPPNGEELSPRTSDLPVDWIEADCICTYMDPGNLGTVASALGAVLRSPAQPANHLIQ